jgi:DNA-binding NarL/FixJ family response regulator
LLKDTENFTIVAEANTAEDMLKKLVVMTVDLLLTDIAIPGGMDGFELSLRVKKDFPDIRILALSMNEEGSMITKMIEEAKVDGYIPKAAGQQELFKAIEEITSGLEYFSPTVIKQYKAYQKIRNENIALHLTNRELQIIECILQHLSNKQIAARLFISERTVETHRKNIYRKTDTKGEASLIQFVKEHKLFS